MRRNLWQELSPGDEAPEIVNVVVEIPKGSKVKYEFDKETGLICVDRILHGALHFPLNYGFIPQTLCQDNDPLDVLIVGDCPFIPGCLLSARIIGGFTMLDSGEKDDKIIAVHQGDPMYNKARSLQDINPFLIDEVKNFFSSYKILEKKEVAVGDAFSLDTALQITSEALTLFTTRKLQDAI